MLVRPTLFSAFALAVATPLSVSAQSLTWVRVASSGPPQRCCHAMAYDVQRQRTVLFGGWDIGKAAVLGDTWEWDGKAWKQVQPKTVPASRCCHAMTYDSGRGRTIMFGGAGNGSGTDLSDTWEWDGTDWTKINTQNSPRPRRSPMLTYHLTSGKTLLFGGGTGSTGSPFFQETWTYDGKDWTQLSPKNSPLARWGSAFAFQLTRAKTLLFGGAGEKGAVYNDTWEWDGNDWTKLGPKNSPSARWLMSGAFSLANRRVFVFGGRLDKPDTWEWDGVDWTPTKVAASPGGRSDLAMVYEPTRKVMTVFGGFARTAGVLGDTWELVNDPTATYTSLGKGCQGSAGVPALAATSSGPIIAKPFVVNITNVPTKTNTILLLFGFSKTQWGSLNLPWDMSPLGMPGCTLYASADVMVPLPSSNGGASLGLTVPNDSTLVNVFYFNQAYVPDQTLGPFGACMSNAAEAKIGSK